MGFILQDSSTGGAAVDTVQTAAASGATTVLAWGSVVLIPTLTGNITLAYPTPVSNEGKKITEVQTGTPNAFTVTRTIAAGSISLLNSGNELTATNGALTIQAVDATNARQVSSIGTSPITSSYVCARVNTATPAATNDHIQFVTTISSAGSDIVLDNSTAYNTGTNTASIGRITFKANKTYRIVGSIGSVGYFSAANTNFVAFAWFNSDTGTQLGGRNVVGSDHSDTSDGSGGSIELIFTPTVDTRLELRIVAQSNLATVNGGLGNGAAILVAQTISGGLPFNVQASQPQGYALIDIGSPTQAPNTIFSPVGSTLKQTNLVTQVGGPMTITLKANRTYEVEAGLSIVNYGAANANFPMGVFSICSGNSTTPLPNLVSGIATQQNLQSVPAIAGGSGTGSRPAKAIVTVGASDLIVNLASGSHSGVGGTDLSAVNFVYLGYFQALEIGLTGQVVLATEPPFTGATSGSAGVVGNVVTPLAGDQLKFLRGDATWQSVAGGSVMTGATGGAAGTAGDVPIPPAGSNVRPLLGSGKFVPAAGEAITIQTGTTGVLTLDSTATINMGTGSGNNKAVTINNQNTGSITYINGGNGIQLLNPTAGNIDIRSDAGLVNIQEIGGNVLIGNNIGGATTTINSGTGFVNLNPSSVGGINLSTGSASGAVNIATGATSKPVNIGSSTNAASCAWDNGAGSIDIALSNTTGSVTIGNQGARNISIGNLQTGTSTGLLGGSNGLSINAGNGGVLNIGDNANAAAINIATGSQNALNLGTGGTAKAIGIGNIVGATSLNMLSGTGGTIINTTGAGTINIGGSTSTGAINIANGSTTNLAIGGGSVAKSIQIGNSIGATSVGISSGTGGVSVIANGIGAIGIGTSTGTGAVNIATGSMTTVNLGTGGTAKALTIGNNTGASSLSLQSGTGSITMDSFGTGQVIIGNTNGATGTITIGLGTASRTVSIGGNVGASSLNMAAGTSGILMSSTGTIRMGGTQFFPSADNVASCGSAANRWVSVFAVNGAIQTSDRTLKANIRDLTGAEAGVFLDQLRPVEFMLRADEEGRVKTGLIAQEVLEVDPDKVWGEKDGEYGLNYADFVGELIACVQDLRQRVAKLERGRETGLDQ